MNYYAEAYEFRKFHCALDESQEYEHGSPQALQAIRLAQELFDLTYFKWPESQKIYRDFYKGLLLMIRARSDMILASDNTERLKILKNWHEGYKLIKSNNFEDAWISWGVHLSENYFNYRYLSPHEFKTTAIDIIKECRDGLYKNKAPAINKAIVHGSIASYLTSDDSSLIDHDINEALDEIKKAQSLINKNNYPVDWAIARCKEGNILANYKIGNVLEHMTNALIALEEAENIFKVEEEFAPERFYNLQNWAMLLKDITSGNREENLEKALDIIELCIENDPKEKEPFNRAGTLINKSTLYMFRIKEDKLENLNIAYDCILEAHDLSKNLQIWSSAISCNNQLAHVRMKRHKIRPEPKIDEIEEVLKENLNICEEYNDIDKFVRTANLLAEFYSLDIASRSQNELQKSVDILNEAIKRIEPFSKYDAIFLIGVIVFVITNFSCFLSKNNIAIQDKLLGTKLIKNKRDWRIIKESDFGLTELKDKKWEWVSESNGRIMLWINNKFNRNVQKIIITNGLKGEVLGFCRGVFWSAIIIGPVLTFTYRH